MSSANLTPVTSWFCIDHAEVEHGLGVDAGVGLAVSMAIEVSLTITGGWVAELIVRA